MECNEADAINIQEISQSDETAEEVLFSEPVGWVCYWATILLVGIAAVYLIRWQLAHPIQQMKDPWPLDIPPAWLVDWICPVSLTWSLGSAGWCAFRKEQNWKMLVSAGGLAVVMVCTQLLEIYF